MYRDPPDEAIGSLNADAMMRNRFHRKKRSQ
jgi:hypothetical protein